MKNLEYAQSQLLYVVKRSGIIWAQLVLNPTAKTYRRISRDPIAQDPKCAIRWAYGWLHFTFLIFYISFLLGPYRPRPLDIVLDLLSLLLITTILLLLLAIYSGATQYVAKRWLKGKGDFSKTIFIFSGLISALVTPLWFI